MSEGTDWGFFDRPASQVESTISAMSSRADEALAQANAIIGDLSSVTFAPESGAPNITLAPVEIPDIVDPTPPGDTDFGNLYFPGTPTLEDMWTRFGLSSADFSVDVDPFDPQTGAIVMPARPAPIDASGQPERPEIGEVTLPTEPEIVMPDMGALVEITVPEFIFPTLPTFDGTAPEFSEPRPATNLVWAEPTYQSELLDDATSRVREWLQGGTGLPPAIQEALFAKAREREMQTALEATQGAFDTWAGRGFTMPPGMLVEQVNVAQEKSRLAQNTLEREILVKAQEWEIENLRVAVERGIALETVLINQFQNSAQRIFDAAKYRVEADINVFNAMVGLFNARSTAYQTEANVWKTRVEAEMMKLDVFKAEIEAEKAKGQLNEQAVRVYEARIKAVQSFIEIYKTRMDGAKVKTDVIRTRIEAFRSDVEAYGSKLDAEKKRFEAYEAEVRGETAKASALEAEARAYAATVSAQTEKANLKVKYVESRVAAIRAGVDKFTAELESEKASSRASLEAIQARTAAFSADVGRYSAEIAATGEERKTELSVAELRLRNNLAFFETAYKEYDARLGRIIEQAKIVADSMRAAGQFASALAQGAMSAIHVQASMSGSGNASSSSQYSNSFQEIHNYKHGG